MGTTRGHLLLALASLLAACSALPLGRERSPRAAEGPFSADFTQLLKKNGSPSKVFDETPSAEALKFLQTFGYLEKSDGNVENFFSGEAVIDAIKLMQKFGAIPQTGQVDNATVQLMHKPRCGVADLVRNKTDDDPILSAIRPLGGQHQLARRRIKRFVQGAQGWRKRTITYFISNWTPKLSEEIVATEMQKAFQVWAEYGNLKFIRVRDPSADIIVGFGRGPHGDGYAFDGPGMVLAHAFYPYEFNSFGGDIHFDDDEKWKLKLEGPFDDGVDFFSVAVHELGHSLGLAHSPEKDSVMFPYFKGFNSNPARLAYDDVLAMYHIYVSKNLPMDDKNSSSSNVDSQTRPPTRTTPSPRPTTTTTPRPATTPYTTRTPYRPPTRPPTRPTSRPHHHHPNHNHPHHNHPNHNHPNHNHPYYPDKRGFNGTTPKPPSYEPSFEGDYDTVTSHRKKFGSSTPVIAGKVTAQSVSSSTTLRTDTEMTAPKDGICEGGFDTVGLIRGEIFIAKGNMLWRLSDRGVTVPGYPVPFRRLFWQLPEEVTKIDAIYERPTDSAILIFSGDKFWETDGDKLLRKVPRPLTSLGLPSSVKKIDAIMVWGKNGKTYIFSENSYWKFDESKRTLEAGYPLKITERWRGVPSSIDAAMTFKDGLTYFFKGKNFWRFNDQLIQTDPQYPKLSSKEWLSCA